MSKRRWIRWSLITVGILGTGVFATGWWLVSTEAGLRSITAIALARTAADLRVGRVSGRLRGPFQLHDVRFTSTNATVLADTITVHWRLAPLLSRTLAVEHLDVRAVDVVRTESSAPRDTAPPAPITLPVMLEVNRVSVNRITVVRDTSVEVELRQMTVTGIRGREGISIDSLESTVNDVSLTLSGTAGLSSGFPMSVVWSWRYDADHRTYRGRGTVGGDLTTLQLTHDLTQPTTARLTARVYDAAGTPSFDAEVDVPEVDLHRVIAATPTDPPVPIRVHALLDGTLDTVRTTVTASSREPRTGPVDIRLHARITSAAVLLDTVVASLPGRPGILRGSGVTRLAGSESVLDLSLAWSRLGWPLTDRSPPLRSSGRGRINGTTAAYAFTASGTVTGRRGGPLRFTATGTGTREQAVLEATARGAAGRLNGSGRVSWSPDIAWEGTVRGDSVDPRPFLVDSALSINTIQFIATTAGRVAETLRGTVRLRDGSARVADVPVEFAGSSTFSGSTAQVDNVRVGMLGGTIDLGGTVGWASGPRWDIRADVRDVSPERWPGAQPSWTGALSALAQSRGHIRADTVSTVLDIDTVFGTVRDRAVQGAGRLSMDGWNIDVSSLSVTWGQASALARGSLGERLDLRLELDVPDLSLPVPEGSGQAFLRAHLTGDRATPALVTEIGATDVRYGRFAVNQLATTATLDMATGGAMRLQSRARDVTTGDQTLDSITVALQGVREDHVLTIAMHGSPADVTVGAQGSLGPEHWSGRITRTHARHGVLGEWIQDEPADLHVAVDSAHLDTICLRSASDAACATGWATRQRWSAALDATQLSLTPLAEFAGVTRAVTGGIRGDIAVSSDSTGALSGGGRIEEAPGQSITLLPPNGPAVLVNSPEVTIRIDDAGVSAAARAVLRETTTPDAALAEVDASLRLPTYRRLTDTILEQPFTAHVRAEVPDLGILEAAAPRLADPSGSLDLDVTIDGTAQAFELRGSGHIRNFSADVPALGVELRRGDVTLEGDTAGLTITGQIASDPGLVRFDGRVGRTGVGDTTVTLRVFGEQFGTMNTPEITMHTSPDLTVDLVGQHLFVNGTVPVPYASIELQEIPTAAVQVSRDASFVEDTIAASPPALQVSSRVRIILGDSVSFRGFGLTAQPEGSVLVVEEPGRARTATGQLVVDGGRYRAYRQELAIETGRLIYAGGSVDDPGLEVRATRRATDGTVAGLDVRGTLRAPVVSIFSEPEMIQSEALSYVLFGRPIHRVSVSEGSALAGAARSLGLSQGNLLTQRLGRRFGLDEARLESEQSWEDASFVAGKYLSPRLFVSYTVGLFEPRDIFHLRYLLSSKWTLRAETGDGTKTEIRYKLQRSR